MIPKSDDAPAWRSAQRAQWALDYLGEEHPLVQGNALEHLRDGAEAYPAMLAAIRASTRTVRLETYMFLDDEVGDEFSAALVGASERGSQVTVLYDFIGSWETRRAFFRQMRQKGVRVRAFRPLSWTMGLSQLRRRDHRKLLIIDGEVAFVGGINIGRHWAPKGKGKGGGWRDDMLRVEGPVVPVLERRFRASWLLQVRERLRRRRRVRVLEANPPDIPESVGERGDVALAVLASRKTIHQAYLRAIDRARSSVLVAAAYFVPDRKLLRALKAAAARGVEVRLILAGQSDVPLALHAGRAFYERLLGWGVKIHEWSTGVLHSKTAVVDGVWATVGSFNLESQSLRFNHEVNLAFTDERWGHALEDSFRKDSRVSVEIQLASWRMRPWWRKILEKACYVLRTIL